MSGFDHRNVLILIPAYNEEARVGVVARPLVEDGYDVLVIDDGSSDRTSDAARMAGAEVIRLSPNAGKGAALRRGFRFAVEDGTYLAVALLDADEQHDPAELPAFFDKLSYSGAALVVGDRMHLPHGMPPVRRVTNMIMSGFISLIARQHVYDSQCGYRVILTSALRGLDLRTDRFEIETEMILETARRGHRIASVPIGCMYGSEVSSIRPVRDTLRFFAFVVSYLFRGRRRG